MHTQKKASPLPDSKLIGAVADPEGGTRGPPPPPPPTHTHTTSKEIHSLKLQPTTLSFQADAENAAAENAADTAFQSYNQYLSKC